MKGTKREFMVHDSPPQNGVSKREMRTRAERARAILILSSLPRFLWKEAMQHLAWLQDQTPAQALNGKTPYEMGHQKKPNLISIQEFGAATYIKDMKAGKLDARAMKGCFVGYNLESKGYQIYWPKKRSYQVADMGYYYVGRKSELSRNSWRSRSRTSNGRDLASTCVLRPCLEELVSLNFGGTELRSRRRIRLRNELQYTNWENY
jgi:hypothetical protein